ncbi:MAG: ATP-binding protein, partial [Coriobacteriales bacterium]|nr:ATP-binding protein [Coriobacteriales bacterium]
MGFVLGAFFKTAADIILGISTGVGSNLLADKIKENLKDAQSLEYQMFLCMEEALEACCNKLDLVYEDTDALSSSFFVGISQQARPFSESTLGDILADSLGEQANSFDRSYLARLYSDLLFKQLAQSKYEELYKYLMAKKILPDSPTEQKITIKRTLTPHINTVSEDEVLGRDEFVEGLKEQLEARPGGKPCRLHLTGMGGIGKTGILRTLFTHYCDKNYVGTIESVIFVNYSGSADDAILKIPDTAEKEHDPIWERLKATADSRLDQAWRYLRALAESYSILLLVDDVTLRETGQAPDFEQEDSFKRLLELNTPLVLASRYRDSLLKTMFKNVRTPPLPLPVLQDIYVKALNDDDSDGNRDIPVEDEPALHELFEERAGLNTLVIQRLGAIAGTQGFGVSELCNQLDKLHFVIKSSDGDDDDTLQKEVSKLYDTGTDSLNPPERNIVEAFSLFPALTLDVGTCVEWLQQDTGLSQRKLREALSKLARGTWLQKTSSATGTAHFSMHQLVAVAVTSQSEAEGTEGVLGHPGLLAACAEELSYNEEKGESFQKATPYIAIAQSIATR